MNTVRPERKMPTLWALARFWTDREPFCFDVGELAVPFCFACEARMPYLGGTPGARWESAAGRLERAHLVDRIRGGLDQPQNIVPLCNLCHRLMPTFGPEEAADALAYVAAGGCYPFLLAAAGKVLRREGLAPD